MPSSRCSQVLKQHALASPSGKIEEKMGLRASETAELVLEDCRVSTDNLLGGLAHYEGKANSEGFKAAMKTFDSTRPLVGIMAVEHARAARDRRATS